MTESTEPQKERRASDQWIRDALRSGKDDTSALSEDISAVQLSVNAVQHDVATVQKDVASVKLDVDGLRNDIAEVTKGVAGVHSDLSFFKEEVLRAIPDKSPKKHLDSHVVLEDDLAARKSRKALWEDIRNGIIKTAVTSAVISAIGFIIGLLALGLSTQFGMWVRDVPQKVTSEPTKEKPQ